MKNRGELSQCDKKKKASTKAPIDDILNSERFSPKNGRKEMMFALITPILYITGSSSHCSRARKRNKRLSNWKERSKSVSFSRGHDRLCENPEESTKKTHRINEFNNASDYRVNIQVSTEFLYTDNKYVETKFKTL